MRSYRVSWRYSKSIINSALQQMDDLDIYRAAQATIQEYGDGAALHAAQRADELMAEGDMEGRAVWHRIERAIDELQRTAAGDGEGVH